MCSYCNISHKSSKIDFSSIPERNIDRVANVKVGDQINIKLPADYSTKTSDFVVNTASTNASKIKSWLLDSEQTTGYQEEKENMITREAAEALAAQAAQALAIVNEREARWGTDDFKNGQILYADVKWLKRENCLSENAFKRQRTYNYAFIKAGDKWYSSGPRAGGIAFTWDTLINWLNERYIVRFGAVDKLTPVIRKDKRV